MKKVIIIIIVFLFIGSYMIFNSLDEDIETTSGKISFAKSIGSWILQLGNNVKDLTGHAIGQEWMPDLNETNKTNESRN
jgi:hypothetical protein